MDARGDKGDDHKQINSRTKKTGVGGAEKDTNYAIVVPHQAPLFTFLRPSPFSFLRENGMNIPPVLPEGTPKPLRSQGVATIAGFILRL